MARRANRRRLTHWAVIQSISNFARGVGTAAENAFAFFGNSVSPRTRTRIINRLTGNDKAGREAGKSLVIMQRAILRAQKALILGYDNFQHGLSLQFQRGEHSSAFF